MDIRVQMKACLIPACRGPPAHTSWRKHAHGYISVRVRVGALAYVHMCISMGTGVFVRLRAASWIFLFLADLGSCSRLAGKEKRKTQNPLERALESAFHAHHTVQ